MDDLMEGMVGEGSLMRQAIKGFTSGRVAADNPTMMKEKEFGMISENTKKLLDVKAKLVALSMDTSDVDVLIQKKLAEPASHERLHIIEQWYLQQLMNLQVTSIFI